ncbi:MAG TPA: adenylate/guanylate cyclase domain-containing protein [Myxococcaceae bacterium]|nr:adenylate/guanylate cyclase domain-containing protein [Myxococcaceae bacterium]
MYGPPVSSSATRFLRILGFSLMQALMLGTLVGLLVYFRAPRVGREAMPDPSRPFHQRLRDGLEAVELWTYDLRLRELAKRQERPDSVVLVAIDDETLANARKDENPFVSIQPWPRELVGGVVDRLLTEGASLVVVDLPLFDSSPSTCPSTLLVGPSRTDDDALRSFLEKHPGGSVLPFSWSEAKAPPTASPTKPLLVFIDRKANAAEARDLVRSILSERHPAFVIPQGKQVQVWAGVSSEAEGRELAPRWGAKGAVGIREFFPNERPFQVTPVDLLLGQAEVRVEGLDPASLPRARSLVHPVPALLGSQSRYGATDAGPDFDGTVRGIAHLTSYTTPDGKAHLLPSAALTAAMRLAGTRELKYAQGRLHIGDRFSVPMDESGFTLLQWDAPEASRDGRGALARALSAWRFVVNLLQPPGVPARYKNDVAGRVVILTQTSRGSALASTAIGAVAPGAVQGQALANLLRSEGMRRAEPMRDLLATLAMSFIGAFLALTFGSGSRSTFGTWIFLACVPVAAAGYGWYAWRAFHEERLWLAMAGPMVALVATFGASTTYALRLERRLGDFVRAVLGRSVRASVAGQVARDLSLVRPERRQVTVFFSDLEGFSELCERLPPEKLVALLNEYLTEMTAVVQETSGQVDHYVGDTLTAFWGAPLRTNRHAHQACEAALRMREVLGRRQEDWLERFGHRLEFRAGLNTGEAVVGDMGSDLEPNYTVMGDVVSLAGRLERECARYKTLILVGEGTARAASDAFFFREVDRVRVRGRGMPVQIFELVGRRQPNEERPAHIADFERGLLLYYERRFLEALQHFTRLSDEGDPVAGVFARRCDGYLENGPPDKWDGVSEDS